MVAKSTGAGINILQKTLTFVDRDIFPNKVKEGAENLKGYFTGSLANYPEMDWEDKSSPLDGNAIEPIGTVTADKNRPLIYTKGNSFKLTNVVLKNNSSTSFNTSTDTISVTSSNGKLNVNNIPFSISGNEIEISTPIVGSTLDKIGAENVALTWTIKKGNTSIPAGTTDHLVYTVGAAPSGRLFHTLVDIGTRAAAGRDSANDIFNGIWGKFTTLSLNRIDGEGPLKYYGEGWDTPGYQVTDYILFAQDGQCGAWANFLIDTLDIQDIDASVLWLKPKKDRFTTHNGHIDYAVGFVQREQNVQGGSINLEDGARAFGWHAIVKYNDKYYDPSTGVGHVTIIDYVKDHLKIFWLCDINGNGIDISDSGHYADANFITDNNFDDYFKLE